MAKARLVFLHWDDPLPSSEAVSRHGPRDPRVDLDQIERQHGPLPTDPTEQNRLWYRLYRTVEADPSAEHAHREYLFTRDYASLAFMMIYVLGGAGLVQIPSIGTAIGYLGLLIAQFVLVLRAARDHGRRFVVNVLALVSARR